LRSYYKDSFREELGAVPPSASEEDKRIEAEIEAARKLGFTTKKDLEEFREAIKQEVRDEVEQDTLSKAIDQASAKHGVDRKQLIEFMYGLHLEDPDSAAAKLGGYVGIAKPKIEVPKKPEVLNTEKKGSNLRVPDKVRPIPHPDKDPEAFEKRILEFLEHKTPEEV